MTSTSAPGSTFASALAPGSLAGTPRRRVLIVDDSKLQRRILRAHLGRLDVDIVETDSGEAALERLRAERFDIVVSDWMMPGGMTGLELCLAIRSDPAFGTEPGGDGRYIYFILSTSKGEKEEIAQGLNAGADDFVTKPVDGIEIAARIQAGERILAMQEELAETNRKRGEALAKVRALNASIERDLEQARLLQHALVRRWQEDFGTAEVTLMLRSSGHVGGDLVGFARTCATCVGIHGIDVSGHGIASALMSARLAGYLSTSDRRQHIATAGAGAERCGTHPPSVVASRLNDLALEEMETETYFTLLYAELSLRTGRVSFVQAGHPPPLVLRGDGTTEFAGGGGLPVGLIPGASWDDETLQLAPGDRLLIYSDGVTECEAPSGAMLEEPGLARIAAAKAGLAGRPFLEAILKDLEAYAGTSDFGDDVSMALIEYRGV
jgi:sigma-B regulation protein RsbU (phosphoserine phosphatase)